jgi:hypothetical protein
MHSHQQARRPRTQRRYDATSSDRCRRGAHTPFFLLCFLRSDCGATMISTRKTQLRSSLYGDFVLTFCGPPRTHARTSPECAKRTTEDGGGRVRERRER